LMDVPEIAERTGAAVIGSANVCELMRTFQIPERQIRGVHAGEEIDLPYARVKVIPATHPRIPGYRSGKLKQNLKPPLHLRDFRMDDCYSYLIEFGKIRLLIWSSISAQNVQRAEVVCLRAVASAKWYGAMMDEIKPKLVIPTHWDELFRPIGEPPRTFWAPPTAAWPPMKRINLEKFTQQIQQAWPDGRVLIPEILKTYQLLDEMNQPE
jgi:L-ascorbate metabolism protein UlaG (beta-lactamase superfamily)